MDEEVEKLFFEHNQAIYRYIYWLVKNRETAEDLTQDTFCKALKSIHKFQHQSSELTWLLKIARNITYDYFRRKGLIRFLKWESENDVDTSSLSPESSILQNEELSKLYQAFDHLKKDYRDVLILRQVNECSIKETAYILGWTEAKVKAKMSRAFEALKQEYNRKDGFLNEPIKRI
ncbi:RNA polymerase sigma-70 factor, ECF subfamily [Planococcus glaciei]|uniref:RNA polymerase sigma factor n=1 Tax=Planococcus glaciei TaxID=459472 RepID=UPI000891E44E|nr:sigma-70 family RNA polymerase sigma factor [Planococcus glaciei]SDH95263.1 RNA polymerase sigma-70 factor, ECF subfamily [Planococcus glaciei]